MTAIKVSRLLLPLLLCAVVARAELALPENPQPCVSWAALDLQAAIKAAGFSNAKITVSQDAALPAEAFELRARGGRLEIRGADANGCMYGIFEAAERIQSGKAPGWVEFLRALPPIRQQPFIAFRADNPFCHRTPFLFDDVAMWTRYIDMLARNRFNALDIHGGYDLDDTEFSNLLPLLIHVPEYPAIGDVAEQRRHLANFKALARHAHDRGLTLGLMNYDAEVKGLDKSRWSDYTARAVAILLREVPELTMLGFRVGESGMAADFYRQAYLRGLELSARTDVSVYTRSWKADAKQLAAIGRDLPGRYDIEIKFNGEQLGLPYQALHGTHLGRAYASYSYQDYLRAGAPYGIIWQVRANGTHRFFAWAGTDFIRRTIRALKFGHARGFSLEPHIAYFSTRARDYYRSREDQQAYRYIWEKHWMWYLAWGRLAYNPELPEGVLRRQFEARFGAPGSRIYDALQASAAIIPTIMAYRFQGPDHRQFSPETDTGCQYEDDPELSFMRHEPMDARNFASISQYVAACIEGRAEARIGPRRIAAELRSAAAKTRAALAEIDGQQPAPLRPAEWRLLRVDLEATACLGEYYSQRIEGTLLCCYALKSGSKPDFEEALHCFEASRQAWKKLADTADPVYAPLNNPLRAQRKFRWSRMLKKLQDTDRTVWQGLWSKCRIDPNAKRLADLEPPPAPRPELQAVQCSTAAGHAEIRCRAGKGNLRLRVWFKPLPSEEPWTQAPMQRQEDGRYCARIPLDERGALFQIEVSDRQSAALFPDVLKARPYWIIEPCGAQQRKCVRRSEALEP